MLFSAALEQAEQFFRAAAAVGPETRALLVFYGLAQTGRALRAVAQEDSDWHRSGGHGLTVVGASIGDHLSQALVMDQKKGHFRDVAAALGRASVPEEQTVGSLSRLLSLGTRFALDSPEHAHMPLRLELTSPEQTKVGGSLRADLAVPAATWAMELPPIGKRLAKHYDAYRAHVREQLQQYPTLRDAELYDPTPEHFDLRGGGGTRWVGLAWPGRRHPGFEDSGAPLHEFSDDNGRSVLIYPRGAGADLAVHPYLLWWAVLFAMAHHIRYEPTKWAAMVDVDRSDEAVTIEHIGEYALKALPELIHRTLVRTEPE
ncbi:YaaC family protein [Myceligenerans crystallogenes]|uniref:YaaC-like Protein n=1 Tax=Myceligenerans crystallogenes TaxID=316335 RepID=A0ABP4ZGF1_9MICO